MKLNSLLMLGLLFSLVLLLSSINAAETHEDDKKEVSKPDQVRYGGYQGGGGWGGGPGYGGYPGGGGGGYQGGGGWGGYQGGGGGGYQGGGGGGWGGGWGGRGCRWGCCGGRYWGGGCRFCCRTAQEATAYNNMMMMAADEANP